MKQKVWHNLDHADAYLSNSVIRIGDIPILVNKVSLSGKKSTIFYWKLGAVGGAENMKTVSLDSDELNLNPVPLGMLAQGKDYSWSYYLSRSSRRTWKQGLSSGNMLVDDLSSDRKKKIPYSRTGLLYSSNLFNTIRGEYPSFKGAKILSESNGYSVAFNRCFAVWGKDLYYKNIGIPVGNIKERPILFDEFNHLKEILNEAIG